MKRTLFVLLTIIIGFGSCKKKERIPWEPQEKKYTNDVKKSAQIFDENTMNTISIINDSVISFPLSNNIDSLVEGHSFMGSPCANFPEGLLRNIVSVDTVGSDIIIGVQEAALFDVFENYKYSEIDFNSLFSTSSRNGNLNDNCKSYTHNKSFDFKKTIDLGSFEIEVNIKGELTSDYQAVCFDEFIKPNSTYTENGSEYYTVVKEHKMVGSTILSNASLDIEVVSGSVNNWFGSESWRKAIIPIPIKIPTGTPLMLEFNPVLEVNVAQLSGNLKTCFNYIANYDQIEREEFKYKKTPGTLWGYNYTVVEHKDPFFVKNNTTVTPEFNVCGGSAQIETKFTLEPQLILSIGSSTLAGIIVRPGVYLKGVMSVGAGTGGTCDVFLGFDLKADIVAASFNLYTTPTWVIWEKGLLEYFGLGSICDLATIVTGPTATIKYATDAITNAGGSAVKVLTYKFNPIANDFIPSDNDPINSQTIKLMFDHDESRNVIRTSNSSFPSNAVWNSLAFISNGDIKAVNCSAYDPFTTMDCKVNAGNYFYLCIDNVKYEELGANWFNDFSWSKRDILSGYGPYPTSVYGYGSFEVLSSQTQNINIGEKCVAVNMDLSGNAVLGNAYSGPYLNMP